MALFKDMLKDDESLFKNELALDYSFIPKLIPFREQQQREIASCINPLFQKRNGKNLLIHGMPGIGKTVACRHIFQEIEEETVEIVTVFINCWQKNTSFKIFLDMCEQLGIKFTQNKKTDELFNMIKQVLNKKAAVFAFDEIDKVEDFDFLYSVLEEIYRKTVLLISNYGDFLDELDGRVKSRLVPGVLEFKPYNLEETRGILKQRMEYAFVPGVFSDDALNLIVNKTAELRDIRMGLSMMREAGIIAENKSSRKILLEHARESINKLDNFTIKKSSDLTEDERKVLELVRENSGRKIGDVFKLYQEKGGNLVYKSFQRKIKKLELNNFISLERKDGGAEGNTTIVNAKDAEKKLSEF